MGWGRVGGKKKREDEREEGEGGKRGAKGIKEEREEIVFFFKQKTAYEIYRCDLEFRRVLFRSIRP